MRSGANAPRRTTLPPTEIGGFAIQGSLGRGGMGVVYRAIDPRNGRNVAVKTVSWSGEGALAALRREIVALSAVRHPGVVEIVAEGLTSERPWYAMELIEGRSLRAVLRARWHDDADETTDVNLPRHPAVTMELDVVGAPAPATELPAERGAPRGELGLVLEPFARLCAPLAHVHAAGIVHRDLTPDNVIVRADGAPVLVDFGLAEAFRRGDREALAIGGAIVGTTHYMAPEQVRGEVVDARADLYSLGCMLYEAITGRPPFVSASPHGVLTQHLYSAPLPPSQRVDGVPPWLDGLVLALLAKDARERLGYASDVAAILNQHRGGAAPEPSATYLYRPRMIGRGELVSRFEPMLAAINDRCGALVVIGGPSGVGKTRLAVELATRASAEGVRVIAAECTPPGTDRHGGAQSRSTPLAPLRPLLQAVADRCHELGPDGSARLLGDRAAVLAGYEPALRHLPGVAALPPPPTLTVEGTRARLYQYLRDTLHALAAEGPLLMLIDDVQWADELTLCFLAALGPEALDHLGVGLLLTHRTEVPLPALAALRARPDAVVLDVRQLGGADVDAMVADMLAVSSAPPGLLATLTAQTDGVPFHVGEFLRAAVDDGVLVRRPGAAWVLASEDAPPGSLAELLRHRLARLGRFGRAVVRLAAVLGREFEPSLLAELTGVDGTALDDAIRDLVRRHIFEESSRGRLRFAHEQLRETAYAELDGLERTRAHRDAARALERRAGAGSHELYPMLAHHWSIADEPVRAVEFLEKAGERALAMGAYQDTLDFLRRALAMSSRGMTVEPERRGRWQRWLGEAAWGLGDIDGCGSHFEAAIAELDRPLPTSRTGWLRVTARHLAGQLWRGVHRRAHPTDHRAGEAALAASRLSYRHYHGGDNLAMIALNLRAVALADRAPPTAAVATPYWQLGYLAGMIGMPRVAAHYYGHARDRARATADDTSLAMSRCSEASYLVGAGRLGEARRTAREAVDVLRRIGHVHELEVALTVAAHIEHDLGDHRAALALSRELYESSRERRNRMHEAWGACATARELLALGEPDDAVVLCAHAAPLALDAGDRASLVLLGGLRALAEVRRGRHAEARDALDEWLGRVDGTIPAVWSLGHGYGAAARGALALLDHADDAAARARARAAVSHLWRHALVFPVTRPAALACAARLAHRAGRTTVARWLAGEALARAQAQAMPGDARDAAAVVAAVA